MRIGNCRLMVIVAGVAAFFGCTDTPELAAERERRRSPVSIRGYIWDIDIPAPAMPGTLSVVDPAQADTERKARIFGQTYISIDDVNYASGGLIDTGAFVILDAPPRDVTMLIQPPVVPDQRIVMHRIPPNADVYLPGIIIDRQGLRFADPSKLRVRIPGETARGTGQTAQIGPHEVPIEEVPVSELMNRREYPEPVPPAGEPPATQTNTDVATPTATQSAPAEPPAEE